MLTRIWVLIGGMAFMKINGQSFERIFNYEMQTESDAFNMYSIHTHFKNEDGNKFKYKIVQSGDYYKMKNFQIPIIVSITDLNEDCLKMRDFGKVMWI